MNNTRLLDVTEEVDSQINVLIQKSHKQYIDLETTVDWHRGVDRKRFPKRLDAAWAYGTRFWDRLTEEQKLEVTWKETARDFSIFIWLERTLPSLYVGYLNQYGNALPKSVQQYLMIFSKEEIIHTLMFERFLEMGGLEWFSQPQGLYEMFMHKMPKMPPVYGVLGTYLAEMVPEMGALHSVDSEDCDPLTRQVVLLHHGEEVRHLAFGRKLVECYVETATPEEVARLRDFAEPFARIAIANYTYNSELPRHLSFDFGVAENDVETAREIRSSANNQRLFRIRFGALVSWMEGLGLVGPDFASTWALL
jgi:hypothetical protein